MFQIKRKNDKIAVKRNGKLLKVMDFDNNCVLVKVAISDLKGIKCEQFPDGLQLSLHYKVFCSFINVTISKTKKGFRISSIKRFNYKNFKWIISQDSYLNALKRLIREHEIVDHINIEKAKEWQNLTFSKEIDKNKNLFNFMKKIKADLENVLDYLDQVMCFLAGLFKDDTGMD